MFVRLPRLFRHVCGVVLGVLVCNVATPPTVSRGQIANSVLIRKGQAQAYNLWRKGFLVDDDQLQRELQHVLNDVVEGIEYDEALRPIVHVMRRPELNAFALPDGSIFVNVGLLARLNSIDEVAFVLAHEAYHAIERHAKYSIEDDLSKRRMFSILSLGASLAVAGVDASRLGILALNYAAQLGLGLVAAYAINGYSRELESDADQFALEALRRTGRDGCASVAALRAMLEEAGDRNRVGNLFWGTHPLLSERMQAMRNLLGEDCDVEPVATSTDAEWTSSPEQQAVSAYAPIKWPMMKLRSELWRLTGRPRESLEAAQSYVARFPGDAAAHVVVGDAYRAIASGDTLWLAYEAYRRGLALGPRGYREPLRGIALTAEAVCDTAAAIAYLERYLDGGARVPYGRATSRHLETLSKAYGRSVDHRAHERVRFGRREPR